MGIGEWRAVTTSEGAQQSNEQADCPFAQTDNRLNLGRGEQVEIRAYL
jgi:hypothetical protein